MARPGVHAWHLGPSCAERAPCTTAHSPVQPDCMMLHGSFRLSPARRSRGARRTHEDCGFHAAACAPAGSHNALRLLPSPARLHQHQLLPWLLQAAALSAQGSPGCAGTLCKCKGCMCSVLCALPAAGLVESGTCLSGPEQACLVSIAVTKKAAANVNVCACPRPAVVCRQATPAWHRGLSR